MFHPRVDERPHSGIQQGSPRYVGDSGKRQEAIAAFQRYRAQEDADANKGIADLRKALANPTQRSGVVANVGEAETTCMATLSDDQLKEEIINSSVQRFEETMFVPKVESANYARPQHALTIAASPAEVEAVQRLLREGVPEHGGGLTNFPELLEVVPPRTLALSDASGGDKAVDADLGPYYFLTGFTVSHDYEWHWGAEVTINWCIVGCSATYGLELHAGFNYAFGLRFPIQTEFKYHIVVHPNNSSEAKLTATFNPIKGGNRVRREKVMVHIGSQSRPGTGSFHPAARSGGGNETAEASGADKQPGY